MLTSLSIRNFVIVDALELEFGSGLTVLTGETGAGKSIIIDALSLLLGGRGDGTLVREGAARAELAASFRLQCPPELAAWLDQQALTLEEDELLLRRVIDASGRSKSYINGQPITLAQLKVVGEFLVDIHGQHAHQSLTKSDMQRKLLDAFAEQTELAAHVRKAFEQWQIARRARIAAEQHSAEYQVERERLEWQINELSELGLTEGEWATLGQRHNQLANAVELIEAAEFARYTLSDGETTCLSLLNQITNRLGRLAHLDSRLEGPLAMLASAEAELQESAYALRDYAQSADQNPEELMQVERRMETLHEAARKYRVPPEGLLGRLQEWQTQLAQLAETADVADLIAREAALEVLYREQAEALSLARQQAAHVLGERVTAEMQHLAMAGARFAIELPPLAAPSAHGLEGVEYLVAANAGTSLRPLAKVASGGELSRVSLALQVIMSRIASVPTLIFDEVDVGIGGRVAEVVGRLLRQLGAHYQVLCITHLPQVAACGQAHWQVAKYEQGGRTVSTITPLDAQARTDEIARMLGGERITDTTREHAREMLSLH